MKLPTGREILADAISGPLCQFQLVRLLASGALTGYCKVCGDGGEGVILFERGKLHLPHFTKLGANEFLAAEEALDAIRSLTVKSTQGIILNKQKLSFARIICQQNSVIAKTGLSVEQFWVGFQKIQRQYPTVLFQFFLDDEEYYLLHVDGRLINQQENGAKEDFEAFLERGGFNLNLYPFNNPLPPLSFYNPQELLPVNWITQLITAALKKEFGSNANGLVEELQDEVIPAEKLASHLEHIDEFLGMFVCSSKQARGAVKSIEKEIAQFQAQLN